MDKNGKKSLQEWLEEFYEDTAKASDIIRNLAFVGIGLIWIFRNPDSTNGILPLKLILPVKLIVLGLICDLMQYVWKSVNIYTFYLINEKNKKFKDITMPNYIRIIAGGFFMAKIILIIIAYCFIYGYLESKF